MTNAKTTWINPSFVIRNKRSCCDNKSVLGKQTISHQSLLSSLCPKPESCIWRCERSEPRAFLYVASRGDYVSILYAHFMNISKQYHTFWFMFTLSDIYIILCMFIVSNVITNNNVLKICLCNNLFNAYAFTLNIIFSSICAKSNTFKILFSGIRYL